ncbi:hypothetical protein JCM17823_00200 [Halorubrum gandharaense]
MSTNQPDGFLADFGEWTALHWVGVGLTAEETPLLIIGGSFLFGVFLFSTRFWEPVLYLVGVVHVGGLGVLWVFAGVPHLLWGVVTGVCCLALAAIALTLFINAERSEP